ncbi:monooxygenase [Striga asiatica]|uniref:Monooxygenase n=1 Tax=Striga asiatica TaxID=4170 RepID=A0A5A7R7P4_STRAF|nr:monooxygenase [Striga asiatica]
MSRRRFPAGLASPDTVGSQGFTSRHEFRVTRRSTMDTQTSHPLLPPIPAIETFSNSRLQNHPPLSRINKRGILEPVEVFGVLDMGTDGNWMKRVYVSFFLDGRWLFRCGERILDSSVRFFFQSFRFATLC